MRTPSLKQVKETYRKHFKATRKSSTAWNHTLEELSYPYNPDMKQQELYHRQAVSSMLRKIADQIDLEEGDPYHVALDAALKALERDKVVDVVKAEAKKFNDEIRKEFIDKAGGRGGPKEWRPKKVIPSEEDVEEAVDRELENGGGTQLELFIMFDEKGGLQGWQIEAPDYWRGNDGPHGQAYVSEQFDADDLRRAVTEALEQVDWDELEPGDEDA